MASDDQMVDMHRKQQEKIKPVLFAVLMSLATTAVPVYDIVQKMGN